jgi:hypothetical protein
VLDKRTPLIVCKEDEMMGMAATRLRIVKPGADTAGISVCWGGGIVSVVTDIVDGGQKERGVVR